MPTPPPPKDDPLNDRPGHPDPCHGAVLLSDQIEFYIKELVPPLLARDDGSMLEDAELWEGECLDTASYKLRLGDEAHVGGVRVQISEKTPLVLQPHQVAIVKTYEVINIPRFLVARWNLRVQWVYEGLLWVGGPQVDPGWQGPLYCPIYNLAEREIVIPYMERVFTMDFTRTTPVHEDKATYGYVTKEHKAARKKNLQGHDINRLRSAPFEILRNLESLTEFRNFSFAMLAVGFAAVGAITAALAVIAIRPVVSTEDSAKLLAPWPLTAVSLAMFASVLSIFSIFSQIVPRLAHYLRRRR